ncbi:glycosyltransferase family 4 protein [Caldisericum exile]|uniref:Undecaprenyl-phosphate N-acetylglucosaminyl 1-phosphate transferase n=1 Tax=Caldisericum exile (strain DSM 21853 / NBRC 104410 / AZM16c01) TaxID=511051 RepID=A0A7U6GEK1_CALEA|nr:MraY family glycosyltransferase [Caldisericum exile]BAL80877.1 undecaprenyl-phosphate N-acetylglucosaminyl 1-phosphate transferase [Caldisericum exile AZM16c01]
MKEIIGFINKNFFNISYYFLIGFFVSSFSTPLAIFLGNKFKIIDLPKASDRKKIHKEPVPRSGGISIYISIVILFLIIQKFNKQFLGIILGATILFFGLLMDDKYGLTVRQKFSVQFLSAFIAIFTGTQFTQLSIPFTDTVIKIGFLGSILTALWIVGLINAINIIDGLDGLASGVSAIASFFLAITAMYKGHLNLALILIGLCGSLVAFLIYNFHPARVFLGDSGAGLLGYMLSIISIVGAYKTTTLLSVALPIFVLGIPIAEVFTSIIRRIMHGGSPFKYDTEHIHYRLLKKGLSQRKIALIYYIITLVLSVTGVILTFGVK